MAGSTLQKGQGISPIFSRYEWRELQKDERSWEILDLYGLGRFVFFPVLFVRKQFEGHGYELEEIRNRKQI